MNGLVKIDYTNWRGERSTRTIRPTRLAWSQGNQWHPEPQWLLLAWDIAKEDFRDFAMTGIHSWKPAPAQDAEEPSS
jgi:predicted DNA-binding transcriptional regulator YafY